MGINLNVVNFIWERPSLTFFPKLGKQQQLELLMFWIATPFSKVQDNPHFCVYHIL